MGPRLNNQGGVLEIWHTDGYRERIGTLGPAGSPSVCFLVKDEGLVAVDPLTGHKRWVKSDVPMSTQLFGDGDYVFLVMPARADGSGGRTAALRAVDGVPLGVPDFYALYERKQRLLGRKLLLRETDPEGSVVLRLHDPAAGQDIWHKQFSPKALLMNSLESSVAGAVEGDGRVTIFDLETGKDLFQTGLDPKMLGESPTIHLLQDRGQTYLFFQQGGQAPAGDRRMNDQGSLALKNVLVNGPAFAFDTATGKERWRGDIPFQALIVEQFDDMPVVLCASYQTHMLKNGPKVKSMVLALDKRDGKTVYAEELDGRNLRLHTLKVNPHDGSVECIGEAGPSATPNYRLRLWIENAATQEGTNQRGAKHVQSLPATAMALVEAERRLQGIETKLWLIEQIFQISSPDDLGHWERWAKLIPLEQQLRLAWYKAEWEFAQLGLTPLFDQLDPDRFDDLANSLGAEAAGEILKLRFEKESAVLEKADRDFAKAHMELQNKILENQTSADEPAAEHLRQTHP
jgi:outer membrane protein assembly factor BamB